MPVYVHKCKKCGEVKEAFRRVTEYNKNFPVCCGEEMPKVICAPSVITDLEPYRSPVDGSIINSRSDHRNHLREHKLIEVGNEKLTKPATKGIEPEGIAEDIQRAMEQ